MWTPSSLIADAIAELNLDSDSFRCLPASESDSIHSSVTSHFLTHPKVLFWWEHLKLPFQTWAPDSDAYEKIEDIVPDRDETILFVPCDDPKNPVFQTSTATAVQVLGECAAFEYAICNNALEWMILENHHDCLFAVGETVIRNMNQLAELAR